MKRKRERVHRDDWFGFAVFCGIMIVYVIAEIVMRL